MHASHPTPSHKHQPDTEHHAARILARCRHQHAVHTHVLVHGFVSANDLSFRVGASRCPNARAAAPHTAGPSVRKHNRLHLPLPPPLCLVVKRHPEVPAPRRPSGPRHVIERSRLFFCFVFLFWLSSYPRAESRGQWRDRGKMPALLKAKGGPGPARPWPSHRFASPARPLPGGAYRPRGFGAFENVLCDGAGPTDAGTRGG